MATEQAASNKSSLLLKIILQNVQTLQLFPKVNKIESILKSIYKCLVDCRQRPYPLGSYFDDYL
jgi:hypothetical protein